MDRLLQLLSENSSLTTAELSMILGEPEDYISAQIREYEKSGIIRGYRAVVNWDAVPESGVVALIELKVAPQLQKGFDEFAESLLGYEQVESVYLMAGVYDLALIVRGQTMQDIGMFVAKKLSTLEGVLSTGTHFIMRRYKDRGMNLADFDDEQDERSLIL